MCVSFYNMARRRSLVFDDAEGSEASVYLLAPHSVFAGVASSQQPLCVGLTESPHFAGRTFLPVSAVTQILQILEHVAFLQADLVVVIRGVRKRGPPRSSAWSKYLTVLGESGAPLRRPLRPHLPQLRARSPPASNPSV